MCKRLVTLFLFSRWKNRKTKIVKPPKGKLTHNSLSRLPSPLIGIGGVKIHIVRSLGILMSSEEILGRVVTRQFLVYLAGPITGHSFGVATSWYDIVDKAFPPHMLPMRPLRGKTWLKEEKVIEAQYAHLHPMSTPNGIMTRDRYDVMRADALLVNLLTAPEKPSLGTIMEIAWGHLLQKPIIVAMTEDNVHYKHPMIRSACSIILPTLDEAIDVTIRMVSPI